MSAVVLPQQKNPLSGALDSITSTLLNKILLEQQLQQQTKKVMAQRNLESQSQRNLGEYLEKGLAQFDPLNTAGPDSYLGNLIGKARLGSNVLSNVQPGRPLEQSVFDKLFGNVPSAPERKPALTLGEELHRIDNMVKEDLKPFKVWDALYDPSVPGHINTKFHADQAGITVESLDAEKEKIKNKYLPLYQETYKKHGEEIPPLYYGSIAEATKGIGSSEVAGAPKDNKEKMSEKQEILKQLHALLRQGQGG